MFRGVSNEPTIEHKNEAIALFMGGIVVQFRERYITWGRKETMPVNELKYHSSWDWLHSAWERFRDLKFDDVRLQLEHSGWKDTISRAICYNGISAAHLYLYKAIQWFNKQKAAQILMNLPQDKEPHGMPSLAADPFAQMEYRGPDSHCKACEEEKAGIKHIQAAKHTCKTKGGNNENNP